ncbi:small GTP-binding protein [Histomonas meleagridis]|nr:small GTP-binding protein [Histomonas meleagridis]
MARNMKISIVGETGVGKSAIVNRFVYGVFNQNLPQNEGGAFFTKQMNIDGQIVNMAIWDTAGQEQFRTLAPMYYTDAQAVIIVFSVGNPNPSVNTSKSSFEAIDFWYNQIRDHNNEALIILCGSMDDLEQREITFNEGELKAKTLPDFVDYFETSSLNGDGIEAMFQSIAEKCVASCTSDPKTIKLCRSYDVNSDPAAYKNVQGCRC